MPEAAIAYPPGGIAGGVEFPGTLPIPIEFDLYLDISKKYEAEKGTWIVEGYASTKDLDLQGDVLVEEALKASENDLLENSTVLYLHESSQPCGRVLETVVKGGLMWIKMLVSKTRPDIWQMVKEGTINKFSIAGKVLAFNTRMIPQIGRAVRLVKRMYLTHLALVSVAGQPKAVVLNHYIQKALDGQDVFYGGVTMAAPEGAGFVTPLSGGSGAGATPPAVPPVVDPAVAAAAPPVIDPGVPPIVKGAAVPLVVDPAAAAATPPVVPSAAPPAAVPPVVDPAAAAAAALEKAATPAEALVLIDQLIAGTDSVAGKQALKRIRGTLDVSGTEKAAAAASGVTPPVVPPAGTPPELTPEQAMAQLAAMVSANMNKMADLEKSLAAKAAMPPAEGETTPPVAGTETEMAQLLKALGSNQVALTQNMQSMATTNAAQIQAVSNQVAELKTTVENIPLFKALETIGTHTIDLKGEAYKGLDAQETLRVALAQAMPALATQ